MATIGIDIKTNFDEAASQLKAFTNLTQAETDRINASLKKLEAFEADSFVEKNKRIALSVGATRGASAALATEATGLERKMQMLIRSGMDPQDAALQKLQAEYNRTTKQIEINAKAQSMNEAISKAGTRTMQAMGIAAVAAGAALFKNAQDTAKRGDTFAKQATIIGTTAEELQKLNYVASLADVPQEALFNAMKKLNKGMGEARMGSGALKDVLEKTNPALLAQLNQTTDSAVAFDLLINAMNKTTNAQDRAALATAAFGKAGQGLISISSMSAEEIKKLKDEAVKYGIISNANAKASEDYMDAQTRMKAAITGVRNALGVALMPVIQSMIEWVTRFFGDTEKLSSVLRTLAPILIAVGGAIATMMVVNKVNAMVRGFSDSMKALKLVLAAHPIMLLVGGIATLAAIFSSGGKSAADFEKEISGAENTLKQLQGTTAAQTAAYNAFIVASKGAAVGSAQYSAAVETLLKQTPGLAQYGVTASTSLKDIAAAQQMLTDSQQAAAVVKADEQYKKLVDGLGELKGAVLNAWEVYKADPTTANLAAAKNYAAQLKRSETAMMGLGQQSGRTADEIKNTFDDAGARLGIVSVSGKHVADSMRDIGNATLYSTKQMEDLIGKAIPGLDWMLQLAKKTTSTMKPQTAPQTYSKPKDMSKEIQDLADANKIRLQMLGDYETKKQQLILAAQRKGEDMLKDPTVLASQRADMEMQLQIKLYQDLEDLQLKHMETMEQRAMAAEKDITDLQRKEHETRIALAGQLLEGLSSMLGGIGSLYQAQTAMKIKALEEQQAAELANTKLTDKEKEALQKQHEKAKAKIEYEGAMQAWRLQVAAGIADGARAILSALNTKPFIPAGLAAAGIAAAMTGIQLATLKASKPKLSAETGGRFIVPNNAGSSRGDAQTMRVNPGETIDVTPRGEGRQLTVNNYLDKRLLWSVTQEGIDSGVITVTQDNLVAV